MYIGELMQSSAGVNWQDPRIASRHMYKLLQHHLKSPELVRFRVSISYATWGGLSLIAKDLEAFLRQGKALETIYGVDNGVTTSDALLYSVFLQKQFPKNYRIAKAYRWNYTDSEFHPKYFEFEYPKHSVCVVGSGNLTIGGLAANHELAVVINTPVKSTFRREIRTWWSHNLHHSAAISPKLIRSVKDAGGSEQEEIARGQRLGAKTLGLKLLRARKPLFKHILDAKTERGRHEILAEGDSLTEKPDRLFLEILEHETGGGHQIQLPVATLATFFGVAPGEVRPAEFYFPAMRETVKVQLTHFDNNTHRIRLRPLKDIPRPAIVMFERTATRDRYQCKIVPPNRFDQAIAKNCVEQTRTGSRRWGFV